ncbi:MAG: NAD(+)/NADH kinase [Anaerolineae bacterium]|nr:NAD(+)/NADH kinase [Anaerolineae bacterium]
MSQNDLAGIIANPASGKDIRRVVAQATTFDNQAKVSILRRALIGMWAMGVRRVLVMPDTQKLGLQAQWGLEHSMAQVPEIELLDLPVTGYAQDSERASRLLREAGVGCVLVLGGDGTVRVVSKEIGEVPLVPVSTGTNNVLPYFTEGTIAGLATGAVATGQVPLEEVAYRHKWLEIIVDGLPRERALVDVAVLRGTFIGSRAVWDAQSIERIVATRADPATIGISAIAGIIQPISLDEPRGIALTLAQEGGRPLLAPLGPGLLVEVRVADVHILQVGQGIAFEVDHPTILALDGERELPLHGGEQVRIVLREDGPWIVDVRRTLEAMAVRKLFDR